LHDPEDSTQDCEQQQDISMAKLSPVNQERLDIVHHLADRLLKDLKSQPLTGRPLERMKLIEQAVTCFEMARLK